MKTLSIFTLVIALFVLTPLMASADYIVLMTRCGLGRIVIDLTTCFTG